MSSDGSDAGAVVVRARSVAYRYPSGRVGIDAVDLCVQPGERVVLMGPNGSGKTTLLRILGGDLRPDGGSLEILGEPAPPLRPVLRRRMAVAEADAVHVNVLTGRENAVAFAEAGGIPVSRSRPRIRALMEALDLEADADTPVSEYSSGMRRKLLLVEAFARDAELFLLDEPTATLDPPAVHALAAVLAARCTAGAAAVVATNDPGVAPDLADRVVFLERGRVVAEGSPADLLRRLRGRTSLRIRLGSALRSPLPHLPGLVVNVSGDVVVARASDGTASLPPLLEGVLSAGARVRSVEVREPDLGDVFLQLTGRTLVPMPSAVEPIDSPPVPEGVGTGPAAR